MQEPLTTEACQVDEEPCSSEASQVAVQGQEATSPKPHARRMCLRTGDCPSVSCKLSWVRWVARAGLSPPLQRRAPCLPGIHPSSCTDPSSLLSPRFCPLVVRGLGHPSPPQTHLLGGSPLFTDASAPFHPHLAGPQPGSGLRIRQQEGLQCSLTEVCTLGKSRVSSCRYLKVDSCHPEIPPGCLQRARSLPSPAKIMSFAGLCTLNSMLWLESLLKSRH